MKDPPPFLGSAFWKVITPPRVAFSIWIVALGKILTMYYLRKKTIIITDWCRMCKSNRELVDHLLLHCPIAGELWDWILCLVVSHCYLGNAWFSSCYVQSWKGMLLEVEKHGEQFLYVSFWWIWKERNQCTFEGEGYPCHIYSSSCWRLLTSAILIPILPLQLLSWTF